MVGVGLEGGRLIDLDVDRIGIKICVNKVVVDLF